MNSCTRNTDIVTARYHLNISLSMKGININLKLIPSAIFVQTKQRKFDFQQCILAMVLSGDLQILLKIFHLKSENFTACTIFKIANLDL